jgi:hypothetical protein
VPVQGVHGWPSGPLSTPDDPKPGLILVTPMSIANSGGSVSVPGGVVTFTGVSSISLNGVFTSAYADYLVKITAVPSGAAVDLQYRFRVSGTDNTTANYNNQAISGNATTITSARTAATTSFRLGVCEAGRSIFDSALTGPAQSDYTAAFTRGVRSSASAIMHELQGSYFAATTAFDGLTIYPASGSITGTVVVLAYRNA